MAVDWKDDTGMQNQEKMPVPAAQADSPAAENIVPEHLLRKAQWIVFNYHCNQERCGELIKELDNLPLYTWQDACDMLSSHGAQDTERVQTSNISDPTFRIAAEIDKKLAQMNRALAREVEDELRKVQWAVAIMDTVLVKLELLQYEEEYANTFDVARQLCIEGCQPEKIVCRSGWRMKKKAVRSEIGKIILLTARELQHAEEGKW